MSEREQRVATIKLTQVIWLLFGLLEALIALRIGLRLIGANPANPFAALIYGFTDLFLWPFVGLVGAPAVGNMVLEVHSLIAMLAYALLAWVLAKIVWVLLYRPRDGVVVNEVREVREVHEHTPPHHH
jgi:hypothetical protein